MNIFWGMKDIFLVKTKLDWLLGSFLCFKGILLMSMYRMGIFLGVAKISNIFLVCLSFQLIIGVCGVQAYV